MYISMSMLLMLCGAGFFGFLLGRAAGRNGRDDDLTDAAASLRRHHGHGDLPTTPKEVEEQARALLARRRKIQAIKLVRQATGMGLKDAKDYVDRL